MPPPVGHVATDEPQPQPVLMSLPLRYHGELDAWSVDVPYNTVRADWLALLAWAGELGLAHDGGEPDFIAGGFRHWFERAGE